MDTTIPQNSKALAFQRFVEDRVTSMQPGEERGFEPVLVVDQLRENNKFKAVVDAGEDPLERVLEFLEAMLPGEFKDGMGRVFRFKKRRSMTGHSFMPSIDPEK